MSDEQMVHINQSDITTAAEIWCSLHMTHEVCGQSAITAAKHTLYSTRATNEDSILDHIAKMCCQANCINQMGCKISDEEFKSVLTMLLPKNWGHFISSYIGSHTREGQSISSHQLTSIISIHRSGSVQFLMPKWGSWQLQLVQTDPRYCGTKTRPFRTSLLQFMD